MNTPFKRVKSVSVHSLTLVEGEAVVVRFLSAFAEAPPLAFRADSEVKEERKPAQVARVMNFDIATGMELGEHSIVGGTVLISTLETSYPNGDYVGRIFEVVKMSKTGKRNYFRYLVTEVSLAGGD